MKTAICPGSFDPVTYGHLDIIRRAAALFDRVIVLVVPNVAKNPLFTQEERMELIRRSTADIPRVEVDCYDGLLADYARRRRPTSLSRDCGPCPISNTNSRWP